MRISGSCAIVTGGASGLGEATVRLLARQGAKVAIIDMDAERGARVAADTAALFRRADVRDTDSVLAALRYFESVHGTARILVQCAGYGIPGRILARDGTPFSMEAFRETVEVNLFGTFNVMRLFSQALALEVALEDDERGVVINTSSIAADGGQAGQTAYSAAKAGISGMTLPAARDLAPLGIRVCAIAPGMFATPPAEGAPEKLLDAMRRSLLFPRRFGAAEEYAQLVAQICENRCLNAAVLRLDGGMRLA